MQYSSYTIEDFARDEFFQQWVFSSNDVTDRFWREFLTHYPSQQANVDAAREFLLAINLQEEIPEPVIQNIKLQFNAAIDRHEAKQADHTRHEGLTRNPRAGRTIFYAVAASLLLLVLFTVYFMNGRIGAFKILEKLALHEETSPNGRKRHVVLEDGTQVWLNAGSTLQFPRDYSEGALREVHLDGEAFFDVVEDKTRPFVVHTSTLSIQVLGTTFNVRSYSEDEIVETTLVSGKVSIASVEEGDKNDPITLMPKQKALFRKASGTMSLEQAVNTDDYVGWKDGWMIFDNKSFKDIQETLERWYNVTIIIEDESSLSCTFSAKFKDKSLQEVLEIFKNTESINYRIEGRRVFIDGALCQYETIN